MIGNHHSSREASQGKQVRFSTSDQGLSAYGIEGYDFLRSGVPAISSDRQLKRLGEVVTNNQDPARLGLSVMSFQDPKRLGSSLQEGARVLVDSGTVRTGPSAGGGKNGVSTEEFDRSPITVRN